MVLPKAINIREEMAGLVPSRNYATHGVDRYPAKMIPHLARFGIQCCSKPGESILDPFCGCGTVLVESRIAGRKATGIDINPLAVLLARVKSWVYQEDTLIDAISQAVKLAVSMKNCSVRSPSWVDYWFSSNTLRQLLLLREVIEGLQGVISPRYISALKAILAFTVRLSSKADPRSPKPFISKKARNEREGRDFNVFEIFSEEGAKFVNATRNFKTLLSGARSMSTIVYRDDARKLEHKIDLGRFNGVVSSPPYLSAQDYYRSSKLEITILGLVSERQLRSLGPSLIGSGRGQQNDETLVELKFLPEEIERIYKSDPRCAKVIAGYLNDITAVINGCYRNLMNEGYCCLILGDSTIRKITLPIHAWIIDIAEQAGFLIKEHFVDTVRARRIPPQRYGHSSVIRQEHILIFKKPGGNKEIKIESRGRDAS